MADYKVEEHYDDDGLQHRLVQCAEDDPLPFDVSTTDEILSKEDTNKFYQAYYELTGRDFHKSAMSHGLRNVWITNILKGVM